MKTQKVKTVTVLFNTSNIRYEKIGTEPYMVVPCTLLKEGVHSGGGGVAMHPADVIEQSVLQWEGIPVVINHPQTDGVYVSARSPRILPQTVGNVYNVKFENNSLRGDLYLHCNKLDNELQKRIKDNNAINVSVGIFESQNPTEGEFNGKRYEYIVTEMTADHLAILPEDTGACSTTEGCGINVNKIGYKTIIQKLQRLLDVRDGDGKFFYLEEVTENEFIYRVQDNNSYEDYYYRQGYVVNSDDNVSITGDPIQVTQDINYNPVTNKKRNKQLNINHKNKSEMKQRVITLIGLCNICAQYQKELNELPDNVLDAFIETAKKANRDDEQVAVNVENVTLENALQVLKRENVTIEDVKDAVTDYAKVERGLQQYNAERKALLNELKKADINEKTLAKFSNEELQGLVKQLKSVVYVAEDNAPEQSEDTDVLYPEDVA